MAMLEVAKDAKDYKDIQLAMRYVQHRQPRSSDSRHTFSCTR